MKNKLVAVLLVLLVTGCESRYRYPCQDPENFDTKECTVDCKGDGTCPKDIYGEYMNE
jgi:hypothetical protein